MGDSKKRYLPYGPLLRKDFSGLLNKYIFSILSFRKIVTCYFLFLNNITYVYYLTLLFTCPYL